MISNFMTKKREENVSDMIAFEKPIECTLIQFYEGLNDDGVSSLWGKIGPSSGLFRILSMLPRKYGIVEPKEYRVNLGAYHTTHQMVDELQSYIGDTCVIVDRVHFYRGK